MFLNNMILELIIFKDVNLFPFLKVFVLCLVSVVTEDRAIPAPSQPWVWMESRTHVLDKTNLST